MVGGFVDIGDLVTNAVVGSRFGLGLAWVVLVGVVGICVYAQMSGRVAAVSVGVMLAALLFMRRMAVMTKVSLDESSAHGLEVPAGVEIEINGGQQPVTGLYNAVKRAAKCEIKVPENSQAAATPMADSKSATPPSDPGTTGIPSALAVSLVRSKARCSVAKPSPSAISRSTTRSNSRAESRPGLLPLDGAPTRPIQSAVGSRQEGHGLDQRELPIRLAAVANSPAAT